MISHFSRFRLCPKLPTGFRLCLPVPRSFLLLPGPVWAGLRVKYGLGYESYRGPFNSFRCFRDVLLIQLQLCVLSRSRIRRRYSRETWLRLFNFTSTGSGLEISI